MATMRRDNDNEPITPLPILLLAVPGDRDARSRDDGWVMGLEHAYGGGGTAIDRLPVRLVPRNGLQQYANLKTRAAFESAFGSVPEGVRATILLMLGIAVAAEEKDLEKVAKLAGNAAIATGKAWAVISVGPSPWDGVAAALNAGLSGTGSHPVTVVLWQKKESQLMPALLCFDTAQALFAQALFFIARQGLGLCRRCGNPFFAVRGNQSWCNYKCRVADSMKRYRAKLKRVKATKKSKPKSKK